MNVKHIWK